MLNIRVAGIIIKDNRVLMVKNLRSDYIYSLGGRLKFGESAARGVVREVYEETGLKVTLLGDRFPREDDFIRPLGIQKNRNKMGDLHIDIIYAGIPNGEIHEKISEESTVICWFTREELEHIDVFPDIKITMDYILKNLIR